MAKTARKIKEVMAETTGTETTGTETTGTETTGTETTSTETTGTETTSTETTSTETTSTETTGTETTSNIIPIGTALIDVDGVNVPAGNGDALCQKIMASVVKFSVVAAELLASCDGDTPKALSRFVLYLKGVAPDFKPGSKALAGRIAKGGDLYPLQRAYNALYWHFRDGESKKTGKARTLSAVIATFLTTAREKAPKGAWLADFLKALSEEELAIIRDEMPMPETETETETE